LLAPLVRLALVPFAALEGRSSRRRNALRAARATPLAELRQTARKRALHRTGAPLVAGPWVGDEVGELLYWIPFLRWVQGLDQGLRERFFVIARRSSAAWYEGIGAGRVDLEQVSAGTDPDDAGEGELEGLIKERVAEAFDLGSRAFRVLPGRLVAVTRADLARQDPAGRRLLEFAAPAATELPDLALPDDFVAVSFPNNPALAEACADRHATVSLDGFDAGARVAAIAGARGFAGTFGADAVLAVLSGVPAAVIRSDRESEEDDLRLISSFLTEREFGRLSVLDETGSPVEVVAEMLRLLGLDALAPV
jgi:hypothetical protein